MTDDFSNTADCRVEESRKRKKTPISKKNQMLFKNIAQANDPSAKMRQHKSKVKTVHLSGNYDLTTRAITTKASSPRDQRYTLSSDVD